MAKKKEEEVKQAPEENNGTDNKVTMIKNGKGKRFHRDRIEEMKEQGWKLP